MKKVRFAIKTIDLIIFSLIYWGLIKYTFDNPAWINSTKMLITGVCAVGFTAIYKFIILKNVSTKNVWLNIGLVILLIAVVLTPILILH